MGTRSVLVLVTAAMLVGCGATQGSVQDRPSGVPSATVPRSVVPPSSQPRSSQPRSSKPPEESASASVAPSDVLTYRGDAARTGVMPGPGPTGAPNIRWTFDASAPIGSQVAVADGIVYVVSTDGIIRALDLTTGADIRRQGYGLSGTPQAWTASTGAETHGSPTVVGGLLVVGANDGAHAFHLEDGRQHWYVPQAGLVRSSPAVVGHTAVFASDSGTATAIDTTDGEVVWSHALGAPDNSSVAAADGVALLGLQNGIVVALALTDGSERWRMDTGDGARVGTVAIADGRVYVATLDGGGPGSRHVAALDLATGRVLWRFASPGDKPAYVPAVDAGRAIVEGEDGSVTALDPASGAVLWQSKAPGLVEVVAAVADGVSYGASNGGFAFAFDAATGTERWRLPIAGVPYGAAVTAGLVLIGTDAGVLYAIGGSNP